MIVPLTPLEFLERARRLFGDLEAVVDGDRRFTYAEHAGRCHAVAGALRPFCEDQVPSDGTGPSQNGEARCAHPYELRRTS